MKKSLIALIACALLFSLPGHARYYNDSGFSHSLDVGAGYGVKSDFVLADVGYNLGYKFAFGLYIGAGPTVMGGTSVDGWYPTYSVGGYAKLNYTVVQMNTGAQPYVEARGGYIYNIKGEAGDPIVGVGIGVHFSERYRLGAYCNMELYDGKVVEYIPTLSFSYEF